MSYAASVGIIASLVLLGVALMLGLGVTAHIAQTWWRNRK